MDLRAAVARITRADGKDWGTGFFIEPGRLLVTCTHVAQGASDADGRIAVEVLQPTSDGVVAPPRRLWTRWLREDSSGADVWDISLLELLEEPPVWTRTLKLVAATLVAPGQHVISYGFSSARGDYGDPAVATVVGLSTDPASRREVIELRSGELTGGYSGAPVVDARHGYVIGVLMATLRPDARGRFQQHTWAIPVQALRHVSNRIRLAEHPLVDELLRVAAQRRAARFDFPVASSEEDAAVMPARLRLLDDSGDTAPALDTIELLERLDAGPCKVAAISGVSGSGKSTWLRVELGKHLASARQAGGDGRIPLYVRAAAWAAASAGTSVQQLCGAVARDDLIRYPADCLAGDLERLVELSADGYAVLVDGLDEITDPIARGNAAGNLRDLGRSLGDRGHVLLITSRPVGELKQLDDGCVLKLAMQAASEDDQASYFAARLGVRATDFAEEYQRVHGIGGQGCALMAALAVAIYQQRQALPRRVIELFQQYVDMLVRRALASHSRSALDDETAQELLEVVETLAFRSLALQELSITDALQCLMDALAKATPPPVSRLVLRHAAHAQLAAVTASHLAVYQEGDTIQWTHLSLRDYFAGSYIASRLSGDGAWERVLGRWRDPNWRGAAIMALLVRGQSDVLTQQAVTTVPPFDGGAPDDQSVDFLCGLLELQPDSDDGFVADIVDTALIVGLDRIEDFGSCKQLFSSHRHPLEQLLRLQRTIPQAAARIVDVIGMPGLPEDKRRRILEQLT